MAEWRNDNLLAYAFSSRLWLLGFVFFALVNSATGFCFPWIYKSIFDLFFQTPELPVLLKIGYAALGLSCVKFIANILKNIAGIRVEQSMRLKLRKDIFSKLLAYDYRTFKETSTGEFVNILIPEVDIASSVIFNFVKSCVLVSEIAVFFVILFFLDVTVFYCILGCFLFSVGGIFVLKNALYNKGLEQSSTRSALYDFYFELFRSIKEVKLYGLQNMHLGFSKDMYKKEKKTASGITFFDSLIGILSVLPMYAGTIIVVISSFYRLANGEISLGFCLMIMMYSSLLVSPLTDFSAACSVMQANFPVLRKISKLFMTKDEDYTGQPLEKISSSIRFENLTFYYRKNSKVLDNLDLQIKFPSFVCIVGKSGSGKSTIINILMKLYHNTYGRALLDNIDISAINTLDLRHIIGIVSQESFILNETLRDNIDLTGELTDERITEICKEARLDTLVGRLEGGVRAMLAENGKNISGGEKQRIILARCLAKKTEVLVLDEATSALDLVTEKEIMETICNIRKNRPMTIIAVTHRPSFAGYSDEILFLEDGKIAERGTLAELAARSERYAAFLQEEGAK